MTQFANGRFRPGTVAIGVAALALGAAVGVSLTRKSQDPVPAEHAATIAAGPVSGTVSGPVYGGASLPIDVLEREASAHPADSEKWQALGEAYFADNRYEDASRAYALAIQADPRKAQLWSALGEARVMASKSDPLPADAARDFRRAVAIDPRDPRARYFLAVEKDLAGDHAGAIDDWLHLLADTPQGAPWESDLRRTIAQVGKINHIAVASAIAAIRQPAPHVSAEQAIPGPSPQELRAAITIPPSQQQVMAEAMVERLDTRLQTDTHDVAGWVMLMRSRITLGQPDKASAALKAAITANPEQAGQIRQEVEVLGVK